MIANNFILFISVFKGSFCHVVENRLEEVNGKGRKTSLKSIAVIPIRDDYMKGVRISQVLDMF